jgi:hypothetical protein
MYGIGPDCTVSGWGFFVCQMERVPATFWGVVAGSFFTIIGIVITNWWTDRRQAAQLLHDRELKNREREMALRKDVFTQVAEAIMAGLNAVTRHGDLSIPHNMVTASFLEKAPAASKAHLIANETTVEALVGLMTELGAAFLRLAPGRFELAELQEQIKIKDTLIAHYGQQRDGFLQIMQHHNIEAIHDVARFQRIEQSFLGMRDLVGKLLTEQAQLKTEFQLKALGYIKQCIGESMRIGKLIPYVLVAAREELEVALGQEHYAEILERARLKMEENLTEFVGELEQNLLRQGSG